MSAPARRRIEDLVKTALTIDPTGNTRPPFAPTDDAGVRDEVESRLEEVRTLAQPIEQVVSPADAPQFHKGELLAGRYRIVRHIAGGGMGAVYEVRDEVLGRRSALKTILPKLVSTRQAVVRFRNEVALAQEVTHRNVCRVHDVGRHRNADGSEITFLTMELLDGPTLQQQIKTAGRLPGNEALRIARDVAHGLDAVHRAGVIHRDLKSANIILLPDRAVLTDFGIACGPGTPHERPTEFGAVPGTPAYMAPELLHGGEASVASDIYAMGVVMYELATGRRLPPEQRLKREPRLPTGLNPAVDPVWAAAIERCLRRDPQERFGSAAELLVALEARTRRRTVLLGAGVLAVGSAYGFRTDLRAWASGLPSRRHVAVLPFSTAGSAVDSRAFADGVTETLTSKLSELEQFHDSMWLVPASEVRGRRVSSVEEARKAFGVTLAITGNIQQVGDRVRINTNAVDARTLKQLSSRTVDVQVNELFALQTRVVESVADMLQLAVGEPARRILNTGQTKDPVAYQLYEQAAGRLRRAEAAEVNRAIEELHQAIARDDSFALAYVRLANAYWRRFAFAKEPADADLALRHAQRAVALADGISAPHATLGQIYSGSGRYDEAARSLNTAIELDPANTEALNSLATLYNRQKEFAKAETAYKRAIDLRPDNWIWYNTLGRFYFTQARYDEALRMFSMVSSLIPESAVGYQNAGAVLVSLGRYAEAQANLRRALLIEPTGFAYSNLSVCSTFQGRHREAVSLLEKAVELSPRNHLTWRNLGDAYAAVPALAARAPAAYVKALSLVADALRINTSEPDNWLNKALYEAKLGRVNEAKATMEQVLNGKGLDAAEVFKSAVVLELIGDRREALRRLGFALRSGYSLEQVRKEPELAQLRRDPEFAEIIRKHSR
jgi:eukaryotic-like serine/threonine-protein kinase